VTADDERGQQGRHGEQSGEDFALVQPLALPHMTAHTSASRPPLASSTPGASIGRCGPRLSSNTRGRRDRGG
jgi:hypothetical protein